MAESLKKAGTDVILLEMMIRIPNARRLAEAALSVGLPVWIGMSCCLTQDKKLAAWDMHVAEPHLLDREGVVQRHAYPMRRVSYLE